MKLQNPQNRMQIYSEEPASKYYCLYLLTNNVSDMCFGQGLVKGAKLCLKLKPYFFGWLEK